MSFALLSVMRSLYRSVVAKKDLSRKAKLSIYWSIYSMFLPSPMVMNFGTEEDPGHSAGLGMPWDPPGRAGGGVQGEGSLGVPAQTAAPATRPLIRGRRWMDGWMDGWSYAFWHLFDM